MTTTLTRFRRTAAIGSLVLATATGALAFGAAPAAANGAQPRYVAQVPAATDTSNDCTNQAIPCKTIQHAVSVANAGDTVHVGAGTYAESVTIASDLTVTGAGAGATTVTGDGTGDPSFIIDGPAMPVVTLEHLAASHNHSAPGIVTVAADLTVTDANIVDDTAAGVLAYVSVLHMSASTVADTANSANEVPFSAGTGVLLVGSTGTVQTSTLRDNASAGISTDASNLLGLTPRSLSALPQTTGEVLDSTVSGNQIGGVVNYGGAVQVRTSTIAGNVGGGVVNASTGGSVAISNATISGTSPFPNSGGSGEQGGVIDVSSGPANALVPSARRQAALVSYLNGLAGGHAAALSKAVPRVSAVAPDVPVATGTSIVGSIDAKQAGLDDCFGTVGDGGYNVSSDTKNTCAFGAAKHDLVKTDPKLGPLAANGGLTKTELLKKGSPAIDVIPGGQAGCVSGATDQRGVDRPQPAGEKCDVGAVELAATKIVIQPASLPGGTVGDAYHATITATGGAYPTYVFSLAPGSSLPDGLSLSSDGHIAGTPTKAGTFPFTVSVNDPVLKDYTIVIAAAAPNGSGTQPISATGAPVLELTALGAGTIFAGFLLMVGAGLIGGRPGRHRIRA